MLNLEIFKQSKIELIGKFLECLILSYLSSSQAATKFPSIIILADIVHHN